MATFPHLSQQELVRAFAEEYLDLKLRDDDFTNPQKQRWQHLFMSLLSSMTETPLEKLNSNFFCAIKDTEHLEVHSDGLLLCLLTKAMQKKLEKAALPNFSTLDITEPGEKRLCLILSAILNYLRYMSACNEDFRQLQSKFEDRKTHYEGLKKENDELIGRINAIRAAQAQQEPKIAKAREENEMKKEHLAELQLQANALQEASSQMKTKAADLTTARAKCSEEIASKKQEIAHLDSQIVHSPERTAQEMTTMEEKLEQMKAVKEDKLRRLATMKAARSFHRSLDAERTCELLRGISKTEEREGATVKQIKGLQNEKQQRHAEFVDLDAQKQSLMRTVIARQEKLDKTALQHRVKEDAMKCQLSELQKTVGKLDAKDNRVRAAEAAVREVQQKIEEQRQEFAARTEELKSEHETLQKAFDGYKKMLQDNLSETMALFKC